MATKTAPADTPNDDNEPTELEGNDFAMSPEFADDPEIPVPHVSTASTHNQGSLSNDELDERGFNDDQDELERAKLNPPTGDWKKDDSWVYEKQVIADDSLVGDIDPKGRTFLVFKGKPVVREANGLSYEPDFRLRISPDKRYKQDKPTEVDTAYKLYLKAKDMYIEKHSEKPTKMAQLRSMLEHDAYVVRTMNGDNGPIIVEVKLKSFQGRKSK